MGCKSLPDASPRPSESFVSYIAPLAPCLPELPRAWVHVGLPDGGGEGRDERQGGLAASLR